VKKYFENLMEQSSKEVINIYLKIITSCINKSCGYFPFLILLVTEKVNTSNMQ